jgi:AcrR family transcriptional regulator
LSSTGKRVAGPKPLRADAQRNRDAIVNAARKVFDTGQYDLRFDDFAALAGVGTGTLYRHFPTREALAAAIYREEITALSDRANELGRTLPSELALTTFLHGMVTHIQDHEGLARTLARLTGTIPTELAEASQALETAVADLVTAAIRDGAIRDDVRAGALMVALHGISAALDRPDWRNEADDLITVLSSGLLRPLANGPSTAGRSPKA